MEQLHLFETTSSLLHAVFYRSGAGRSYRTRPARRRRVRFHECTGEEGPSRSEGRTLECLRPIHLYLQLERRISGFIYQPEWQHQFIIARKRKKLYRDRHALSWAQDMAWRRDLFCPGNDFHAAVIGFERLGRSDTKLRAAKRRLGNADLLSVQIIFQADLWIWRGPHTTHFRPDAAWDNGG